MNLTQLKEFVNINMANGAASMATDALQKALTSIIDLVLTAAPLAGDLAGLISSTSVDPGTPTVNQVYITTTAGTYTNFLSAPATPIVVAAGTVMAFLTYSTGTGYWTLTAVTAINVPGALTSKSATAGLGYAAGAGGAVTQITSKATGVTLNKVCGTITTHNASLAGAASVTFTLTNSALSALTDVVVANVRTSGAAVGKYTVNITAKTAGTCDVTITNIGSTASEILVIDFVVLKGVAA